ncbi:NADPH-dependent FMN reductase [Micromonospora mirobrigensis]|uniref:NADPH-dependent FMN reductase n=1 Tax=Micromonospora mirobrigensis TaxID=262898 RepID=A0A1C4ZBU3_9ACTN|nr:NAD(P)H-dependent oxidoreductase [Micromonospora mirobrigensis]SCF30408.1 NADPH-dependent FMN reductase [Micromonospora mirobrigensis]
MIIVLTTSDSENSRGAECASMLAQRLTDAGAGRVALVDWGRDPATAQARLAAEPEPVTGVVLVAPVRNFGIAASTKSAIEQLGDLFRDRPVGVVMTAGTPRSLLAVQSVVMPLLLDYHSVIHPRVVHLPGEPDEKARLDRFAEEFAGFCAVLEPAWTNGLNGAGVLTPRRPHR